MSLFKSYTLDVNRKESGSYVNGKWVSGSSEPEFTIDTSWQPASQREIEALPSGLRSSTIYKGYPGIRVQTVDQKTLKEEDIVTGPDGFDYRVVFVGPWQNGLIPHYKFLAVREKEIS